MGGGCHGRRTAADVAHRPHTDIALHSGGNLLHLHRNQNITAGKAERRIAVCIAQRVIVHQVGGGVLLGVQAFQQGQRIFRCGGLQAACLLVQFGHLRRRAACAACNRQQPGAKPRKFITKPLHSRGELVIQTGIHQQTDILRNRGIPQQAALRQQFGHHVGDGVLLQMVNALFGVQQQ